MHTQYAESTAAETAAAVMALHRVGTAEALAVVAMCFDMWWRGAAGMHRWGRDKWVFDYASEQAGLLRITCCLFWTWRLPDHVASQIHAHLNYAPALTAAATAAALPLGPSYSAVHVRRGDKVPLLNNWLLTSC